MKTCLVLRQSIQWKLSVILNDNFFEIVPQDNVLNLSNIFKAPN